MAVQNGLKTAGSARLALVPQSRGQVVAFSLQPLHDRAANEFGRLLIYLPGGTMDEIDQFRRNIGRQLNAVRHDHFLSAWIWNEKTPHFGGVGFTGGGIKNPPRGRVDARMTDNLNIAYLCPFVK